MSEMDAVHRRINDQHICPACGQSGNHYVPSVGHLTPPEDAITPYYSCTGQSSHDVYRRVADEERARLAGESR